MASIAWNDDSSVLHLAVNKAATARDAVTVAIELVVKSDAGKVSLALTNAIEGLP